jgi:hypothetical protein
MNEAGRALQDFRQFSAPDYADVKDHLARRRPLEHPPSRATFGLPLAFRYRSLEGASAMFLPAPKGKKAGDRHPSLLFIKIVALGDTRAALFVRLDGAVPGDRGFGVVVRSPAPLVGPKTNALDDFMTSLESRPRGHR